MLNKNDFLKEVLNIARKKGYKIESNSRNGLDQIDFGNKKLHAWHLIELYPKILDVNAEIPKLIEKVAPGRPCTHKPMREIIEALRNEGKC